MAFPLSDAEHCWIKQRIESQQELIVAAAIRVDGATISFDRPGRDSLQNDTTNEPLCEAEVTEEMIAAGAAALSWGTGALMPWCRTNVPSVYRAMYSASKRIK